MVGFEEHPIVAGSDSLPERILSLRMHIRSMIRKLNVSPKSGR